MSIKASDAGGGPLSTSVSLEQLFELAGFKPNSNQYEAIRHVNGPLFLVAGPGSGKTRVLLWRTVNLLVFQGIRPDEVFLSTFTQKAAQQLKDGLLSLLGLVTNLTSVPYDLSDMYVGTVHSLCQRMLRDRAFSQGRTRRDAVRILDELDQYFFMYANGFWAQAKARLSYDADGAELLGDINEIFTGKPSSSKHKATQNLASMLNRFSEENLKPSDVLADATSDELAFFGNLYACYLEHPQFKKLSKRLEELKKRHEQGLLHSVEFLKALLALAQDLLKAEKEEPAPEVVAEPGKSALTELFQEVKTDKTPIVVERIVTDIDEIVRQVRFPDWQRTSAGERLVKQALRKTLFKYQLHREQELFDKAYSYIREYY